METNTIETKHEFADFIGVLDIDGTIKKLDHCDLVVQFISFSKKSRMEGLLSLEDDLEEINNKFVSNLLKLVTVGTPPDEIKKIGNKIRQTLLYYYEEIILCSMFYIKNHKEKNIDKLFKNYVDSINLDGYKEIVVKIKDQIKNYIDNDKQTTNQPLSERYKNIIDIAKTDEKSLDLLIENHSKAILKNADIAYSFIIEGCLLIQKASNPIVVAFNLTSFVDQKSRDTIYKRVEEQSYNNDLRLI